MLTRGRGDTGMGRGGAWERGRMGEGAVNPSLKKEFRSHPPSPEAMADKGVRIQNTEDNQSAKS